MAREEIRASDAEREGAVAAYAMIAQGVAPLRVRRAFAELE
jgi:hypothetical protein